MNSDGDGLFALGQGGATPTPLFPEETPSPAAGIPALLIGSSTSQGGTAKPTTGTPLWYALPVSQTSYVFRYWTGSALVSTGAFNFIPNNVAVDANNNLWFTVQNQSAPIVGFAAANASPATMPTMYTPSPLPGQNVPSGQLVLAGPANTLYLTVWSGTWWIYTISAGANQPPIISPAKAVSFAGSTPATTGNSLAGNITVGYYPINGHIYVVDVTGNVYDVDPVSGNATDSGRLFGPQRRPSPNHGQP